MRRPSQTRIWRQRDRPAPLVRSRVCSKASATAPLVPARSCVGIGASPAASATKPAPELARAPPPAEPRAGRTARNGVRKCLRARPRGISGGSGLQAGDVVGSGRRGRVLKEDITEALKRAPLGSGCCGPECPPAQESRVRGSGAGAAHAESATAAARALHHQRSRAARSGAHSTRLRQTIALRLKEAQNNAAMLTTFNDADMSAVMAMRNQYKDLFEKRHGVKLGFMGFFVKACIQALQRDPVRQCRDRR